MANVTLKGNPVSVMGELPAVGSKAPAFSITNSSLADVGLEAFSGKKRLLNIVPSLDTPDLCHLDQTIQRIVCRS